MNKEQFDICLEFHQKQIRTELNQDTINNARKSLVDGDKELAGIGSVKRYSARKLARKITGLFESLASWKALSWTDKVETYKKDRKRIPTQGVFNAVKQMKDTGCVYGKAAADCDVNPQSVKVLLPRLKRWDDYSERLSKAK